MAAYALPGIFVMGCLVYFMEPYVIRCPEQSEWNIRAEFRCQNITKYFCLYNYIHYTYEEGCTGPEWDIPGSKRVYSRNFNIAPCNDTRYQPIKFVTNGSSDCIFRKSLCTEEGQTLLTNGSTKTDSTCRCDYKQGYAFVTVPRNNCSCRPSEEDCSCYVKKCQGIGYNLSADYECTKDVTKKTVCLLMSENPSEDPHIDMAPTGTPREYDSYAIKRTCDVAILVSIFFLVIIVITICALCHQRLPRCPCLSTNQCSSPSGTPEKKKLVDPEAKEFTKAGAQAVEELNGKTLFAGRAQKKAEGQTELKDKSKKINRVNLFVKNLNHNIDDDRLRKEFSQFGTITSVKVETKDGRSKGFGYVCFRSPEEATKAITEMDGRTVDGKALYVALHQCKEDRKAHLASQYSQEGRKKKLEGTCQGDIELNKRLGDLPENLSEAVGDVHKSILDVDRQKQKHQPAQLVKDMVQWYFISVEATGQTLEEYPPEVNLTLEQALKNNDLQAFFLDNSGNKYIVDLTNYEEFPEDDPTDTVAVLRKSKMTDSAFDMPSNWTAMDDSENLKIVTLQASDQEYTDATNGFQTQMGANYSTILKVERIQNKILQQQYFAKKKLMDSKNLAGHNIERKLWHGTTIDAVDAINSFGFNRSYCCRNAVAYGDGMYFAVNPTYSAQSQYARPDPNGNKVMYICKVLVGEFTKGKKGMRLPPQKPGTGDFHLFDSVVDNPAAPGIFVIFHDSQAYPEYLIVFK